MSYAVQNFPAGRTFLSDPPKQSDLSDRIQFLCIIK